MMNNITIKWVKKASMWVKTTKLPVTKLGIQKFDREWFKDKPVLKVEEKTLEVNKE